MATHVKTIRTTVDDLSGAQGAQEVIFGYEGKRYKIDLTPGNRRSLERSLARYIAAARELQNADTPVSRGEIREWARGKGFTLSDKGRLPATVMDAYIAEQQSSDDESAVVEGE